MGMLKASAWLVLFSLALQANAKLPIVTDPTSGFVHSEFIIDVATPLFEPRQDYLLDPPIGVGARSAWTLAGGTGVHVKMIDIETCFEAAHEDVRVPFYIGNNPVCGSTDHGTAVWGIAAATKDDKGVTGIAHEAGFGIYGFPEGDEEVVTDKYISAINRGIQGAIDTLQPGDILIIEQQMTGPDGYTAVDYWNEIREKLREASDKGIICVQAAGNGGSNLDSPKYHGAFDVKLRDSGCIFVGAAGRTYNRLGFSNYGNRVDAFGYGEKVVTTGYGSIFNASPTRKYTASFNGTSSATPIVAGAVAIVSSIAKTKGRVINGFEMRAALRATGTPQNEQTANEHIGNLPDIAALLKYLELNE